MADETATRPEARATLRVVRIMLLITLLLGVIGTGIELLLLGHTEDVWQLTPIILIACSFLVLAWHSTHRGRASTRALQAIMVLFVLSGFVGLWLHYRGNVEFELEMHRSRSGFELFRAAITGATPALAPGTMIALGLVGLTYTIAPSRY